MSDKLALAYARYWSAKSPDQERAAYHEIRLLGGRDGYGRDDWRALIAQMLRRLAARIEG